jgi:hypothetical protein
MIPLLLRGATPRALLYRHTGVVFDAEENHRDLSCRYMPWDRTAGRRGSDLSAADVANGAPVLVNKTLFRKSLIGLQPITVAHLLSCELFPSLSTTAPSSPGW